MNSGHARRSSFPWQLIASAMAQQDAENLKAEFKKYRIAKSDLVPCYVCMTPAPPLIRVQQLRCICKACAVVSIGVKCPWRARVLTCQHVALVTMEVAYDHLTPARATCRPVLTPAMKEAIRDWAGQGLKPKRMWMALLQRFNLVEATAPHLSSVQRFAHHYVTGKLGGSDIIDAVQRKIRESAFTGEEEEASAFTFTSRTDDEGNAVTGNGSDRNPFIVGVSSKKQLRRADRDP
ncbi:hypothetical protein BBJ28_00023649 [Nothophytophthora sp. Chile5]|nr:hypothetical protein BBJ28_00023649 [Nothophytophthora sp. Chile5]